ncbi:serine hydrolase [Qipengyuania marisflavi]|uniref:Serine hydrolase n=1 Tax=Qipengyuania marisflavi TaxID=2486356 RepID=A0A5S3PE84_9SPHN|nr:serine hydrolase [Qipengyuania marisflavi]TMM49880.1 serine hydrolase [Qipengyuania marisflavi]
MHLRLALALTALLPAAAFAQPGASDIEATQQNPRLADRGTEVVAIINGDGDVEETFAPTFLAAIPSAQIAALGQQLTSQFGPALSGKIVQSAGQYRGAIEVRFEKNVAKGSIAISPDAPHRITELGFTAYEPINDSSEKISAELSALPGRTSAYFGPLDGSSAPLFQHGDQQAQFAIGSTFKLYVLAALARGVDEGRLSWDQTIALEAKSLPGGIMQNWPDGAPVTLHTAATLMISISDNTATDLLIDAIGRDVVAAELQASGHSDPNLALPFLKTLEMFALKTIGPGAAYAKANEALQAAMLSELAANTLDTQAILEKFSAEKPVLIDTVEWFASMDDQRALMLVLAAQDDDTARAIMAVNTALTEAELAGWKYAGFKGGSEPGVLNLTWLLQDEADGWHMLALSWNNSAAPVDTTTLKLLTSRILALAGK